MVYSTIEEMPRVVVECERCERKKPKMKKKEVITKKGLNDH